MHRIRRSLTGTKEEAEEGLGGGGFSEAEESILSTGGSPLKKTEDKHRICNWGILGCANIARKNCRSIALSPKSRLHAIASRQKSKAEAFRDQNCLPSDVLIYEGYDAILENPDIDAVYIPLPTSMHLEWVVKAANARKHILIEKPVAVDAAQLYAMILTCKNNNVLLMDGVMFMHHQRLNTLNSLLKDPRCGHVARVDSLFSFNGSKEFLDGGNIRTQSSGDPLGALGDLGWYQIRIGQICFSRGFDANHAMELCTPSHCVATCDSWTNDGVPLECDGRVYFKVPNESHQIQKYGVLSFHSSFLLPFRQSYQVSIVSSIDGMKDQLINCHDFVLPKSPYHSAIDIEIGAQLVDCDHRVVSLQDEIKEGPCVQEANMFTNFSETALNGSISQRMMWSRLSCQTQLIVNACFDSMKNGGMRTNVPSIQEEYFE